MAVSKYIAALSEHAPAITGEVGIDGQMRAVQEEGGAAAVLSLSPLEGQVVTFKNTTAAPLFAALIWEGGSPNRKICGQNRAN